MNEDDLNRIIREVVALHRANFNENGERARSKLSDVKRIIENHMSRVGDEN
jgi:hypothetical protein